MIHADIGKLMYKGLSASELPFFDSPEWPTQDVATLSSFCYRIKFDANSAMKCTYGLHRASISWFVPIHIFAWIFCMAHVHCTPTMWVHKGDSMLNNFLGYNWGTKEVHHQGDFIKCYVLSAGIVVQYHILKQNLCLTFPYRRWKWTASEWQPLDWTTLIKSRLQFKFQCMPDAFKLYW